MSSENRSKQVLGDIIQNFEPAKFVRFFRDKNRRNFVPQQGELKQYSDENFQNGWQIGQIKFDDGKLLVCAFEVRKPLSERSGKKAQYELGRQILKAENIGSGIFIFYDKAGNFRFSLIYDIPFGPRRRWSNFRRFTYFVSPEQTNKTFLKQIGEGDFSSLDKIKEAFSVEKVTKDFFRELSNWYFWAIKNSQFPKDAEAEKNGREIAIIRLITRLIFIWFMKEKGLVPGYLFNKNKIEEILNDLSDNESAYYKAILQNLFFATLSTKQEDRRFAKPSVWYGNKKVKSEDRDDNYVYRYKELFKDKNEDNIKKLFADIPFLNGGLFECLDKRKKDIYIDGFTRVKKHQPQVPNKLFFSPEIRVDLNKSYGTKNKTYKTEGIINILNRYNFTIDESTPSDVDVALDPELLGRVFENLLANFNPETSTTARKATGSYYTPREIVEYMVDESLKAYFKTKIKTKDIDKKLDELFSYSSDKHSFDNQESKDLVKAISEIKIIDPAVGSGAFPMGVLQRLVYLLAKLDPHNKLWKRQQIEAIEKNVLDISLKNKLIQKIEDDFKDNEFGYGRKLYLIQNCIYGVDIQPIAIQIAKLRFFISLLVDMKEGDIEPLPNLETKFVCANTLLGLPAVQYKTAKMKKLIELEERLFANRKKYFSSFSPEDKEKIKETDKQLRQEILQEVQDYQKSKEAELERLQKELNSLSTNKNLVEQEKKTLFETKKVLVDLNEEKRKEISQKIEVVKSEIEGVSKQLLDKFKKIASWEFYNSNKSADWFDQEWMFGVSSGFDIVIGNPPYGFRNILTASEKKHFRKEENIEFKSGDSAELFCKKCFDNLLKESGILTFIIPKKSLYGDAWNGFRENYWKKYNLIFLLDSSKAFENVLLEQNSFGLSKKDQSEKIKLAYLSKNDEVVVFADQGKDKIFMPNGTVQIYKHLYPNIFKKVIKNQAVENLIQGDLGLAIGTSFFSDKPTKYKLLKGIDIDRWRIKKNRYLKNADKLKKEELSKFLRPKTICQRLVAHIENPKPHIKITACYDEEGIIITNTLTAFKLDKRIDEKFWLAYLNSKFVNWYTYNFIYSRAIRTMDFYNFYIQQIPIPKSIIKDTNKQKPFINLVNQILKITSQPNYDPNNPPAKQKQLEAEIDELVYKLYGLSKEETKIIKES